MQDDDLPEIFEEMPPIPPHMEAVIALLVDALGDRGRREFTGTFLRELVQCEPTMSFSQFAEHVKEALDADLNKPGGGYYPLS